MDKLIYLYGSGEVPVAEPLMLLWEDGSVTWDTFRYYDKGGAYENGLRGYHCGKADYELLSKIAAYIKLDTDL